MPDVLNGMTLLHIMAERGDLEGVVLILEHGADVAALGHHERTALHYAAQRGHAGAAEGPGLSFLAPPPLGCSGSE